MLYQVIAIFSFVNEWFNRLRRKLISQLCPRVNAIALTHRECSGASALTWLLMAKRIVHRGVVKASVSKMTLVSVCEYRIVDERDVVLP